MLTSLIDKFLKDNPLPNEVEDDGIIKFNGQNINDLSYDDLLRIVNEHSNSPRVKMGCLKIIALKYEDKMTELIEGFKNSYMFSASSGIKETLKFLILKCPNIDNMQRYQAANALFHVAEKTIEKEASDEIEDLRDFNIVRFKEAGDILHQFCLTEYEALASPCKIEALFKFLKHPYFFEYFIKYIKIFIVSSLPSDYKYKAMLSIEKNCQNLKKPTNPLWKRHISPILAEKFDAEGSSEEQEEVEEGSVVEDGYKLGKEFIDFCFKLNHVILDMFIYFLRQESIEIEYRILASQNSLNKPYISKEDRELVQKVLLDFTSGEKITLKEQQLADICDVLLQYGDDETKKRARVMIKNLGFQNAKGRTIFDNSQNVHTLAIEESVIEILEHLNKLPTFKVKGEAVNLEYVYKDIEEKIKSPEFYLEEEQRDSVTISLNRISLDRALYSNMSCTLSNILIKVWSYIQKHQYHEELYKRLLQELVDMSGWCSSGFAFRLLNTLSGFGEFDVKISWSDQITANFSGRFTARINAIADEEFKSNVINGFTVSMQDDPELRRIFLDFFMSNMPYIREEMWIEFREYIQDDDFDLSFRKAVAQVVEGITLESGIKNAIEKQKKKEEKSRLINDGDKKSEWE